MSEPEVEQRLGRARRLLRQAGLAEARVRCAGPEREIAVLSAPAAAWDELLGEQHRALVAAIKQLGFRYVALDLDPVEQRE